jgi:3-hydroxymyristoyl/3-hydroxydecanoyl-(acyl carrier protein) dehydratase
LRTTKQKGIDGVKFRKPVVPGDTLVMEVELVKFMASFGIAKLKGKAYVDGDVAVEVKVRCQGREGGVWDMNLSAFLF